MFCGAVGITLDAGQFFVAGNDRIIMSRKFSYWLAGWCFFVASLAPARAHIVQQLFGELRYQGSAWQLEIWFDAGYADPDSRANPAQSQPTRDWLVGLAASEQTKLVRQAEDYLREYLVLRSGGDPVEWRLSCPDLATDPPDFPVLLNDGAYFRLLVESSAAARGKDLAVGVAGGRHPDLALKVAEGSEARYLTLRAGLEPLQVATAARPARPPFVETVAQGFLHVIPEGSDHVLFILGIFLLRRCWRALLSQSLVFTVAHATTLGLAACGWIVIPGSRVEPLIALSISALAIENLLVDRVGPWRLTLVFAFGLLHGVGFAGALANWIPRGDGFALGLLGTNLGVELGQLTVLGGAWVATCGWSHRPEWECVRRGACGILALTGLWWFVARLGWV